MIKWICCLLFLCVFLIEAEGTERLAKIRSTFYSDFSHQMMETSQGKIAVWDSNPSRNGPTIIFIHGHGANKEFFEKQLKSPLFKKYRLIALDLPGYGESQPPKDPEKMYNFPGFAHVVAEVVEAMQLNHLVIVGWSLGGHVALELTSFLDLEGLLLTGTPPIEISSLGMSQGFKVLDSKTFACFGKGHLSYEEAQLFATISGYDFSEEKEFIVDAILETDEGAKTIYPRSIALGMGQNEVEIVKKWPKPIAIIAGAQETAINNDYIIHDVEYRNLWEDRVHMISEGGHGVFMECPEEFNLIMLRFLHDVFQK